jgi:predicted outer membrane repeat protein
MGRNLTRTGLVALAIALTAPAAAHAATTYVVNTEADNAANAAECLGVPLDCSLRQAIDKSVSGDTVSLPAGHYTVTSELDSVNKDFTIAGAGNPIVDGGHAVRIFRIRGGSEVSISGVTVTGGKAAGDVGGAFLVPGKLNLTDSTVTDSDAGDGAAIALTNLESSASARILRTTISGNRAERFGGGIYSDAGKATLINSTVTGNTAGGGQVDGAGGGIYLTEAGSDFFQSRVVIYNSTIVGNMALGAGGKGGNLFQEPPQVAAASFAVARVGVAKFAVAKPAGDPPYLLKNTIVGDGTAASAPNCGGDPPVSQGNNLVNTSGECGTSAGMNDVNGPAGVSALQNNGGPTLTRKLLPGSKAIDNGNGCVDDNGDAITTDQRIEMPRPIGAGCDIGAIEFAPPLAVTKPASDVTTASATIHGDVSNLHIRPGTSYFEFGTSTAYGQTFDAGAVAGGAGVAAHDPRQKGVTGLSPNTTYHYRIVVQNEDDISIGPDEQFRTGLPTEPGPQPQPGPGPGPQPGPPEPTPKPKRPTVRAARASSGCVRSRLGIRLSVHVASVSRLRSVVVTIDGKRVKRTTRRRFSVQVSVRGLKSGTHVLRVVATDSGNRTTTIRRLFRRCRPPAQPAFTG